MLGLTAIAVPTPQPLRLSPKHKYTDEQKLLFLKSVVDDRP
jgi:hypothetical protein